MNGKVILIGAGPGDPELITLRALNILKTADAVVFDHLVNPEILGYANSKAEFHNVGKIPGCNSNQQDEINNLLLKLTKSKKCIARLKGGDPFIFGRGGEELLFLSQKKIVVEVIPGITAATGCAAAYGIPLTHRGVATSVRFITGHLKNGSFLNLDWNSLADPTCTLVFYMAVANAHIVVDNLLNHGRSAKTPAALIHAGTTKNQNCAIVTLQDIPLAIKDFPSPCLLIIGEVANINNSTHQNKKIN